MAVDYSKYHSILDSYEPYQPPAPVDQSAPKQNTSALADFGTDLKRGVQQVPSAVTGLLDIPVAAVTGRPMVSEGWEGLGKITGFQPQKWSDEARAEYSTERQAAQQQAAQAEGFADTAGVYLSNPSMLAGTVLESMPSIALGGVYGRALRGVGALSGVTRGAIGEGAVMAGQSMNQMVEDGVDPRRAAAFAAGVGAAGGALGVLGGSLTQRMGLVDVDTLAAGGARAAGVAAPGLLRRVVGGAVAEGTFEELPQTLVETSLGNLAADRPWDEDLGKNAAVGLLAGSLMGGVVNIPGARRQRDMTQDAPQGGEAAPVEPSALEAALRTDTMPVQQWVDQQLNIGASQAETRKNAKAAFEGSVEPTLILDENGAPRTTTSAFDVYEFNNAFDARMAKQAARGQGGVQEDTQTPQTPQTPQAVDEDPAATSLRGTQYANAIFKKDGAMRQNAERAWQAYSGFSGTEIDAALEELAPQPKAAWRIAMLESIRDARAQQAQPQGAPNVAQMDAASGQGAGAVPAGSAGVAPSGPVDLGRVDQPARASAPGSGAGVPVGSPVVQQPAGVAEGAPVQNVPPTQQVAQETQETGRQEVAPNPAAQSGVAPRQRPITPTAETAVLERAVDAQPTNLTEVQTEVYDYVIKAVQDGRIDEIVDAQGVLMHQNIARALGKKRGSIKSALTLVMPKIARAAGVSVDQMVSALRATRNKVAETAAETRLGLSPDAQSSVVEGEDVFGDDATMGVIESVGGSRQDLGEGANWQRLINQGVPFSKRPGEKSPGWTETTISEAVLSGELDADQQQAAEQELLSREARRLARERSADEPTVDAEAIGQAPAAGRRTDEAVERLAEQERLAQEVEERRALEAKARRALLEAEMEWANLAGEIELAEVNWDSTVEDRTNRIRAPKFAELPPEAQHEFALVSRLYEDGGIDDATLVSEVRAIAEEVRSNANTQTTQPAAGGGNAQIAQGVPRLAVERAESPRAEGAGQAAGTGEEVASTPTALDVGRTAAREYAAGALTRLQQYYDTPNLAALASRLENASDLASLDSELDTDQEWEQDFNLSNSLEKVRRDAAAIERLAAAHPEAFELGYLRAQDYGGFASDTPVSELISHMSIASVRPSAEFGSPRDYYVQRDAQASEGVNQIDSRTLGVGDGNRFSRTADTQGTTVESVRSAINDIATPAGKRKITVVQSADELVEMGVLKSSQARGTQGYVTRSGDAFFIADNIRPGNELAVVLHEIGAHLGIEKLLTDKQYEALVKKIFDWAASDANTQEARIARAAIRRVAQAKIENDADLSPETIAYFIEEAVKAGVNPTAMQYKSELGRWFRTLWAAFKVALRRLNLINADRLTAQNVVDLAYGAARIELASTYHGTAANFRRFDHRFMGSGEGAQAFGWGTYLAQRFGIANEYFEADVGRKSGVLYKGEAIKQSWPRGQEPTDLETALAAVAARFADSYSLRTALQKGTVTAADFKSAIADAQYELASDNDMAAHDALENVRPEDFGVGQAEGNIHIVDVNFTEDEMLDWFEPISKQSPQVREALETVFDNYDIGIAGYDNLDMTGEQMYKRLSGSRGLGSDKAASEYLDSLGIKGIKFLDAKSRGQKRDIVDKAGAPVPTPTRPTPGVRSALTFVTGFDSMAEALAEARKQAETYPSMSEMVDVLAYWVGKGYQLKAADQTRNLVIFNDRNIYRVGSMRGGPVDKGGRMMFSKAADPQLVEIAQESGQRALKAIQAGIRKGWTGLAFSSHLANAAHRAGLTSARALELVQRKKATRAYEIQIEVEKVLSKFASLEGKIGNEDAATVVQRFIYDSTFDKKWGFKPEWKDDAVVDPEMERRFNALPSEAQGVIRDVFRHGDTVFREKQDLLRKTITGEYEALIKVETDDDKRRKLERQRDKELREAGRLIAELNGPYAPLRRYGNYVVVAKSQKYRDAEAAGPVDAKLKRDENHYVVEFAETLFEAEKLQSELESKFGKGAVWAGEKEASTQQFGELPFMAVQRLRKMVDTDLEGDLNTKSKRTLNKLLVDLYISTLHEANARHSEQKRQYVNRDRARAAGDMMRAFATQGRADSHLVSALQFNSEIVDEMQKLRNEAKAEGGDSKLKTRLRNEILQRHMMDLDFRETPVQDKLMSLNSFWMLLTSPGYYVQNATQVMMMTQPVLAGKFGQNRSMRHLMRGYQDAMRVLKGSSWNEAADLSRFNGTADEKAMLIELQARGTLDFGISAELGYWESRGEISKVFNQVMRKVGMGTRKLEVMNRMSSALAAYRMMHERSTGTQTERHAAALEYADSIIKDTHGDYSTANAPRYLRMLPKVMTQFRKFQLIQLSLFAKVIHGSVSKAQTREAIEERRAMRAALGYLFMNHALLAGAVGVPASALLGAIYAIAGDDDDPNDWEVDVRRAIGDKEMADLILHGLPSLVNINMSNKIGAGTMLDPLPFVEYEATRGGYEKVVTAAMGPLIGGLGAQVVDAVGRIMQGDVAQGTAQLLPRGFRDAARGFMAAQEGVQLRNGQTALTPEELSFYDSLMMGLGLPTMKTTSRTETQFKTQQYETFFRERVTKLKRQYSEAYEENDRQAMLEARQGWAEMQASRKNLGFKVQPLSELLKAPREKAKAEAKLQSGVRTTEQARGFVQSLQ